MTRLGTLLLAAVAAGALAATSCAGAAGGRTALTVQYWEDGARPATRVVWTLRCAPAAGSHPRRAAACRTLDRLGARAFAPVPKDMACTELYGGPQRAIVSGTLAGRRVWARLSREDGCQIERWNRVAPSLLPAGGAT